MLPSTRHLLQRGLNIHHVNIHVITTAFPNGFSARPLRLALMRGEIIGGSRLVSQLRYLRMPTILDIMGEVATYKNRRSRIPNLRTLQRNDE